MTTCITCLPNIRRPMFAASMTMRWKVGLIFSTKSATTESQLLITIAAAWRLG